MQHKAPQLLATSTSRLAVRYSWHASTEALSADLKDLVDRADNPNIRAVVFTGTHPIVSSVTLTSAGSNREESDSRPSTLTLPQAPGWLVGVVVRTKQIRTLRPNRVRLRGS